MASDLQIKCSEKIAPEYKPKIIARGLVCHVCEKDPHSQHLVANWYTSISLFLIRLHLYSQDVILYSLPLLLIQTPRWLTYGYQCYLVTMDTSPMSSPSSPVSLPLLQQGGSRPVLLCHNQLLSKVWEPSVRPRAVANLFPLQATFLFLVGNPATVAAHPQDVLVVICNSPCCTPFVLPSRLWQDCTRFAPSRMCRCLQSVVWPSASVWRCCSGWLLAGCMYNRCCRHVCYFVRPARMSKLWTVCWNGWEMVLCDVNWQWPTNLVMNHSLPFHFPRRLTLYSISSTGKN